MTSPRSVLDQIDQILTPLGLAREAGVTRAVWRGEREGRAWTVTVAAQSRTRYAGEVRYRQRLGYRLRQECATPLRTRLHFVKARFAASSLVRWIYRRRRLGVVEDVPTPLSGYVAVAREPAWAGALLADGTALEALAGLLEAPPVASVGNSVGLERLFQGRPWLAALGVLGCLVGGVGLFALAFVAIGIVWSTLAR